MIEQNYFVQSLATESYTLLRITIQVISLRIDVSIEPYCRKKDDELFSKVINNVYHNSDKNKLEYSFCP